MDRITTMVAKIKRIILVAKINAFGCNTSTTISKLVNLLQAFYNLLIPSVQAFYNLLLYRKEKENGGRRRRREFSKDTIF